MAQPTYTYKVNTPFAINGSKDEIPTTTEDGSVSLENGYGTLYETPPSEGGRFIRRGEWNYLINFLYNAIKELQDVITAGEFGDSVEVANGSSIYALRAFSDAVDINASLNEGATVKGRLVTSSGENSRSEWSLTDNTTSNEIKPYISLYSYPNLNISTIYFSATQANFQCSSCEGKNEFFQSLAAKLKPILDTL